MSTTQRSSELIRHALGLALVYLVALGVFPLPAQSVKFTFDAAGDLVQRAPGNLAAPQIVGQPQNQIVQPGYLASFSVVMADSTACTYQWLWYGTNLAGQTSDTLLFPNVVTNNQGPYSVVVNNGAGSVTSSVAQLWIDSRGCGMPDWWQLAYFGNLNQTATGDYDGDGVSNLQEFLDGTNPTNNTSFRSHLTVFGNGGLITVNPEQNSYAQTDSVTLTATPLPPNAFYGWTGSLVTNSNPASLVMNTNKTVQGCFVCQPMVAGLVGWWRGEGDASDYLGGHTGTFYTGTTNSLPPSITSTGMIGSAFVFYGTNYIQVQDTNDLRPAQVTLEAWVFPYVQNYNYQTVLAKGSAVNDDDAYYLGINNGQAYFWSKHNTYYMYQLNGGYVPPNQWTHLAATFDGSNKALYVNGLLVASQGGLGPITYDSQNIPLTIGSDWTGGAPSYPFNGLLDEVSLFSRALTPFEVNNTYLASIAGLCTNRPVFTSPSQFPLGLQWAGYTQQVTTVLGTLPVSFSLSAGSLPQGLGLSPTGLIRGVPTVGGSNVFAITATDAAGVTTELICSLQILPVPPPGPVMPAGIVSWWRAENNALDELALNNGYISNGVTFAAGEVGQAFQFNGTANQTIKVFASPSLNLAAGTGITLEAWVKPSTLTNQYPIAEWNDGVNPGTHFWLNVPNAGGGPGGLYANLIDTGMGYHVFASPPGLLNTSNWQHVALTYDETSGNAQMYLNGVVVASYYFGFFVPRTTPDLYLGCRPGSLSYSGLLDEPAVYNRALTTNEIAALYFAGPSGKVNSGPYFNTVSNLPDAVVSIGYTQAITTVQGVGSINYTVASGTPPPGLSLSPAGILNGVPTALGSFTFSVRATDSTPLSNTKAFTVQVYAPSTPPEGLLGWWRAEGNALDQLNLHNGTLVGNATYAPGRAGTAFRLDGNNSYVDLGGWTPGPTWTLEAWVQPFTFPNGRRTIFGCMANCFDWGLAMTSGQLGAQIRPPGGCSTFINSGITPLPGAWYHLAATCDGFTANVYVNGVLTGSAAVQPMYIPDPTDLRLGSAACCGEFFPGLIDEAAIYNRALTAAEIAALYNSGAGGKTTSGPYFSTPPSLPIGFVGQSYTQTLTTARGTAPVTFTQLGGALAPGLTLTPTGLLSGSTLTTTGSYNFTVAATDAASLSATQTFGLQVEQAVPLAAGVVAWWRAETNTLDSAGTNNGILINNATYAPGKIGQAFSFSGINDAVEFFDSPSLRPASITLEAWVMFQSTGSQLIFSKTIGNYSSYSYGLWYQYGALYAMVSSVSGANTPISVAFTPTLQQWYHLAFTFDDATKQQILYINGVPVAFNISLVSIGYDPHPLYLGAGINSGVLNSFFQGRIDEAAIYNRALAPNEIAAIYVADAAGKTAAGPYFVTAPVLPDAAYAMGYTQALTTVRGTPTVTYALTSGSLPTGVTLNAQGVLSGIPTNSLGFIPTNEMVYTFGVRATDGAGLTASQNFTLRVATPIEPPAGMVSWWRAEFNGLDSAGTNNAILLNATGYLPGEVGQAFALDGFSDCVAVPDAQVFHSSSLTLETWFRLDSNGGTQVLYAKPLGTYYLDSFAIWLVNGYLNAGIGNANGSAPILSTAYALSVGRWYHVAYTFDGATRQQVLYLDNSTIASGLADRAPSYDTNAILLGCDSDYNNRVSFLQGRIDEPTFFNRALTAQEVTAIYYAGPAGKATTGPYFTTLPSLADAIINQPYSQALSSTRGTTPLTYSMRNGTLPPGLTFSSSGVVSGTPTTTGTYQFTARVTDAAGLFADQLYTVTVYAPVIAPSGLIGWWRGQSNTLDAVGIHNGILQGNATYGPGKVGTGFSLDGINSYVDLGAWNAGSNWTLEAWVNASALPNGRYTIIGSLNNCLDWGLELYYGQLGMQIRQPGGCSWFLGSGVYPSPGFWYHIAGSNDGTNANVYVNGLWCGTYPVDPNYQGNSTGLRIGSSVCCGEYFPGLVDEVSLYNRPLSGAEISSIYGAGPAGKLLGAPLVLNWTLTGNALILYFPSIVGKTYTIQQENALNGTWTDLYTVTAAGSVLNYTNPLPSPSPKFFRVRTSAN